MPDDTRSSTLGFRAELARVRREQAFDLRPFEMRDGRGFRASCHLFLRLRSRLLSLLRAFA